MGEHGEEGVCDIEDLILLSGNVTENCMRINKLKCRSKDELQVEFPVAKITKSWYKIKCQPVN